MTVKLGKYRQAGVREYWIVDPEKEVIITCRFTEDDINIALQVFRAGSPGHL